MKRLTIIGIVVSLIWVCTFALVICINWETAKTLELNEWGDFLAGFSAPLALFWLVIGFFQQGEELRLNTEALKAQQRELARQVEETATLAKSAERQAHAAERLALLTKEEQDRLEEKEVDEAQPVIRSAGSGTSGGEVYLNLVNRGDVAFETKLIPLEESPLIASFPEIWEENNQVKLHFGKDMSKYKFPFVAKLSYKDKLGFNREKTFEFEAPHNFKEINN